MNESLSFVEGLLARVQGPMSFRLILQPLIAAFFAFRDGRKDAREGRGPYFWALFTDAGHRTEMLKGGWTSIGKVFIIAIILDLVFQIISFKDVRSVAGALIAGVILALIPYLLMRGPVNRLSRHGGRP
jgi:hypothetical protein